MPTVQVAVPKQANKRNLGVFFPTLGIINVEVPPGSRFGDEFEVTLKDEEIIHANKVVKVPLPHGVKPGESFQHRAPNGKIVLVSCPPGAKTGSIIIVPWSDSTNQHFLVQAYLAPVEAKPKPDLEAAIANAKRAGQHNHHGRNHQNPKTSTPGFSVDDIRLAQALSMTTLHTSFSDDKDLEAATKASLRPSNTEDETLELAMKESIVEAERYAQSLHYAHITQKYDDQPDHISKTDYPEDDSLALALKASLAEAEMNSAKYREEEWFESREKTAKVSNASLSVAKPQKETSNTTMWFDVEPQIIKNESVPLPGKPYHPMPDDDELLRKVMELSRREAQERAEALLKQAYS